MKAILAAIDFTPVAPEAICTAARLAVATRARLSILHVTGADPIAHDYEKTADALEDGASFS